MRINENIRRAISNSFLTNEYLYLPHALPVNERLEVNNYLKLTGCKYDSNEYGFKLQFSHLHEQFKSVIQYESVDYIDDIPKLFDIKPEHSCLIVHMSTLYLVEKLRSVSSSVTCIENSHGFCQAMLDFDYPFLYGDFLSSNIDKDSFDFVIISKNKHVQHALHVVKQTGSVIMISDGFELLPNFNVVKRYDDDSVVLCEVKHGY